MKQINVFGNGGTTLAKSFLNVAFNIALVYFCYFFAAWFFYWQTTAIMKVKY